MQYCTKEREQKGIQPSEQSDNARTGVEAADDDVSERAATGAVTLSARLGVWAGHLSGQTVLSTS